MNEIKYDGDLKKDIEYSKKSFNSKKEIFKRIRDFVIWYPVCFLTFIACCRFDFDLFLNYCDYSFLVAFSIIDFIVQTILFMANKMIDDKRYADSNYRIDDLVHQLNEEEILALKENIQSSIIKEHQEKKIEERNEIKNSTEVIENQFYFLDREEKVRLLKSVRKILKEGREVTSDETSLYYSDEDLTNNEDSPVRVIKYLEKF